MSNKQILDLSKLPPPDVLEAVDIEAELALMKADIIEHAPEAEAALALDSSLSTKALQRVAYWKAQRVEKENQDAQGIMLAHAKGTDLDQIAANFGVARLVITPADTSVQPPTLALMESDDDLRLRVQLSTSSYSVAGPEEAYLFYALSASGRVRDAVPYSPTPGVVVVTVLSRNDEENPDGTASAELQSIVETALNPKDVRPLTDWVQVQSAQIVTYEVEAIIHTLKGPDTSIVFESVKESINAYVETMRGIGLNVPLSGLMAALHLEGVERVELIQPTADIMLDKHTQAAYCSALTITQSSRLADED